MNSITVPRSTFDRSVELHWRAVEVIPGDASGSSRLSLSKISCAYEHPCTFYVRFAFGVHLTDGDESEDSDNRMGFGRVVMGHGHRAVHDAVHQDHKSVLVFALPYDQEVRVARRIGGGG